MTPHAPDHFPQFPTTTRTRVKWDNIAIVLFGIVFASFAVVGILASGDPTPDAAMKSKPTPARTAPPAEDVATESALTIEEAQGLVDESRSLMGEARWDEAADRLAMVPAEFRSNVGAPALEEQLASTRATHDRLRAELDAAVEARQWKPALALIVQLEEIATLDTELLEIRTMADQALRPKAPAAPVTDVTKPKAATTAAPTTGGGGTSTNATTKPAAQTTKPKPAVNLPAAQQQELEELLEQTLSSNGLEGLS